MSLTTASNRCAVSCSSALGPSAAIDTRMRRLSSARWYIPSTFSSSSTRRIADSSSVSPIDQRYHAREIRQELPARNAEAKSDYDSAQRPHINFASQFRIWDELG